MSTQIILTAFVENLGEQGDTVKVADGYARNYLIPQGMAIPATKGNLRRVEALRAKREAELAAQLEGAQGVAKKLAKHTCNIVARAGEDGKLFGSVTASDIADSLEKEGIEVDRRKIHLEHPIREIGEHEVEIKLHPKLSQSLKVIVESTEGAVSVPKKEQSAGKSTSKE